MQAGKKKVKIHNILSIDLEDWYHICGVQDYLPRQSWPSLAGRVRVNTDKILKILAARQIKASFFVLGDIAEKEPELIRRIAAHGHEIALHGYAHKRVYRMTPTEFRQDLQKALDIITPMIKCKVLGFRAPEWSIRDDSAWALEILCEKGFLYDSSMAPLPFIGNQDYPDIPYVHKLEGGVLTEFPPLVAQTFFTNLPVGGGWGLRVFPYQIIKAAINKLNERGLPATIFLHPFEFDRNLPKVKLPLIKNLVRRARIISTPKRLERLLNDFEFTTTKRVLERMRPPKQ